MSRRIAIAMITLCIVIPLAGCGLIMNSINDPKSMDESFQEIVSAIESDNADALHAIFSQVAIADSTELDRNIEKLLGEFKGSKISWEQGIVGRTSTEHEYGDVTEKLVYQWQATTEQQSYTFFVIEYTIDDTNPDIVGVYTLRVVRQEDAAVQIMKYDLMEIPGLYFNPSN